MTNDKAPREFWIVKGSSNFCSELVMDDDCETFVKQKPDGFYDIVSTRDTVEGGIHVIEYSEYLRVKNLLTNLPGRQADE